MSPPRSLADFVGALRSSGCAAVTRGNSAFEDLDRAEGELKSCFHEAVEELHATGGPAPVWHPRAALAAAVFFYRACQALVDRTLPGEDVTALAAALPPAAASSGEALSVDLVFRHLPNLHAMARALSEHDPLVRVIESAAARFPLSGIGIRRQAAPAELPDDPWLRRLFLDRVIERQDEAALAAPSVRAAVVDALGEHARRFAPRLAAGLVLQSLPVTHDSTSP